MQRDARCIHGLMPHVSLVTSNLTAFGRSRGLRSASSRRGRVRGRHARGDDVTVDRSRDGTLIRQRRSTGCLRGGVAHGGDVARAAV